MMAANVNESNAVSKEHPCPLDRNIYADAVISCVWVDSL